MLHNMQRKSTLMLTFCRRLYISICALVLDDYTGKFFFNYYLFVFCLIFIDIPSLFLNSCTEHLEKSSFPLQINEVFVF